jgi:hypothetical protein
VLSLRTSRRAVAVVASAAVLFSLAACGGEEKDPLSGVEAPPPGPTASSTPEPTLASAPDAATKKNDEGAKEFAEYFFETVVNEAQTQGKLEKLVEVSDPLCVACRATVGDIAYFTISRQRAEGGDLSVSKLKIANSTATLTTVELTLAKEKISYKNLDGSTSFSSGAATGEEFYVQLLWDATANSWKIREYFSKKLIDKS